MVAVLENIRAVVLEQTVYVIKGNKRTNTILRHIRLSACIHNKVDSFFKDALVTVSGVLLNINSALLPENDGAET